MEWQPIETAPKDGTPVLLYFNGWDRPTARPTVYVGTWTTDFDGDGEWYIDWGDLTQYHIGPMTHWMPLPPPPA